MKKSIEKRIELSKESWDMVFNLSTMFKNQNTIKDIIEFCITKTFNYNSEYVAISENISDINNMINYLLSDEDLNIFSKKKLLKKENNKWDGILRITLKNEIKIYFEKIKLLNPKLKKDKDIFEFCIYLTYRMEQNNLKLFENLSDIKLKLGLLLPNDVLKIINQ